MVRYNVYTSNPPVHPPEVRPGRADLREPDRAESYPGLRGDTGKKGTNVMVQVAVSLADRVAAFIEKEQNRMPEHARSLARKMLDELGLDIATHLELFLAEGAEDEQHSRLLYWRGGRFGEAIGPDVARILRAVDATRAEIEALVPVPW